VQNGPRSWLITFVGDVTYFTRHQTFVAVVNSGHRPICSSLAASVMIIIVIMMMMIIIIIERKDVAACTLQLSA